MKRAAVRAICFDLDNTLWEVEPVLMRAERILADWLECRYPQIPAAYAPAAAMTITSRIYGARGWPRRQYRRFIGQDTSAFFCLNHMSAIKVNDTARRYGGKTKF